MNVMPLNKETNGYWDVIKGASNQAKLELISLLSSSMMSSAIGDADGTGNTAGSLETDSYARKQKERDFLSGFPRIKKEDLKISPWVEDIVKDIEPLPEHFDVDKAKYEYLTKKYG